MMVPGSNLFKMASRVISRQTITYHKFTGRTPTDRGLFVTQYASAQVVKGSFQPVPRNRYEALGLDLQKTYVMFYTSKDLLDLERDVSGDQFTFCDDRYQVESANDWIGVDGWRGVLACKIGDQNAR